MIRSALKLSLLALLFAGPAAAYDIGFVKIGNVPTGVGSYDIKVADLNGDGHPDVVSALSDTRGVSVLFGNGTGIGPATFYSGGNAVAVDLADYDGNGSIDILESDWSENLLRLWKNQGDGTFVPGWTATVLGNPRDVAGGDFNGDGTRDVVAVTSNGKVAYLLGLPGGGFGAAVYNTAGTAMKGVAVGDLDNDGDLDLVAIDSSDRKLLRFQNTGTVPFILVSATTFGGSPSDVAIADFDGDGFLDAAASLENAMVAVLPGGELDWSGPPNTFPIGILSQSVQVADFNGEGGPDLLVSNYNESTIQVLQNQGALQFGAPAVAACGGNPRSAAPGDFDGDGRIDVVSGNFLGGSVGYLHNVPPAPKLAYSPSELDFGTAPQGIAENRTLLVQNVGSTTLFVTPGAIDNSEFGYATPYTPFTVLPGASANLSIRYFRGTAGTANGTLHFTTNDSLAADVAVPLTGTTVPTYAQVTYAPDSLAFGEDYQGTQEVLGVDFHNVGTSNLVLSTGAIEGSQFVWASSTGSLNVPAGQSRTLSVRYLRTALGAATGVMHVTTNDTTAAAISIPLSGSTLPAIPKITYTPSPLDFGAGLSGNSQVLALQVQNTGHATLSVTPSAIDGDQFVYQGSSAPFTLAIGASKSLSIRYLRSTLGPATGSLHLATNDPDAPDVLIEFTGEAVLPPAASFSSPAPITVSAGTFTQTAFVVRNTGPSPLHVTVPANAGDLAEVSPYDLGTTQQEFWRMDQNDALWNLDGEGRVSTGGSGEYAWGMDEANFLMQSSGVLGLGGRELRLGPVAVAPGIVVTRKIYVPGSGGWARYVDVAENPNDTPRTATFDLFDNIGYNTNGALHTSDGDGQFELNDDWIVIPAIEGRKTVARMYRSSGDVPVLATWFQSTGSGCYSRTKYVVTLPPHGRACVIQWSIQGNDVADAQAITEALHSDPGPGLDLADAIDRGSALNLAPTFHPFRPVPGDYVVAPNDSAEIAVVFGGELGTHDADLSAVLRVTTDDPDHRTLAIPLAFSIGNGQVVDVSPAPQPKATLALAGFRPNPLRMSGAARVSFTLGSSDPATLTLYDVRGRVLARHSIEAPQPGPQSLALARAQLAPGVVWMRLEQGGKVATGKGIVLP